MIIILGIVVSICLSILLDETIERVMPATLSVLRLILYLFQRIGAPEYYAYIIVVPMLVGALLVSIRRHGRDFVWNGFMSPSVLAMLVSLIGLYTYFCLANHETGRYFDEIALTLGYMIILTGAFRYGRKKSLIIAILFSLIILISAVDSGTTSDSRYVLAGLVVTCLFFTAWKYYYQKRRILLYFSVLHLMAALTMGRMCILFLVTISIAVITMVAGRLIYRKLLANYPAISIILAMSICMVIILVSWIGKLFIYSNDFCRDVLNSYLGSVFTIRRYSFGYIFHLPVSYFLILSILFFVLVEIYTTPKEVWVFWTLNMSIIIYIIALGLLYLGVLARVNIQNGEYLTGFEDFIQMPVTMVLAFWGCFTNGLFAEETNSK